jgi:predicted nucleic-acid-binding protein
LKAVDTNVLVRVLTRDDPAQAGVAVAAMKSARLYISATVLLETEWVLRHAYGFRRDEVGAALRGVVNLAGATIGDEAAVRQAVTWHAAGMDFADALHLAGAQGADDLVTFDKQLARRAGQLDAHPPVTLLAAAGHDDEGPTDGTGGDERHDGT